MTGMDHPDRVAAGDLLSRGTEASAKPENDAAGEILGRWQPAVVWAIIDTIRPRRPSTGVFRGTADWGIEMKDCDITT